MNNNTFPTSHGDLTNDQIIEEAKKVSIQKAIFDLSEAIYPHHFDSSSRKKVEAAVTNLVKEIVKDDWNKWKAFINDTTL